ncbi:MAG: hypothetical protein EOP45_17910 [Sphingobacteriaceae bacterium]|nr:MAG: hypothetical protein EOP45_17910 [Sphingobacteriaceae bacterium]
MKEFLKKLKLIDHLTMHLDLDQKVFTDRLSAITEPGSTSVFTDAFDVLSSSEKEFKGFVDRQGFKLKRRRRLFDLRFNTAIANGTIAEADGKLTIETEINAFHN